MQIFTIYWIKNKLIVKINNIVIIVNIHIDNVK